ncbi:MAG: hypothetical protein KME46_32440 [Brasilonema angustatum HA4187-MV1]|jgi:hypothetical protein|nr:hypothetical protein [Brasilonema angustatum HA4187-MV1]
MSLICSVLSISNASIYRWLRTGKKLDFFRSYSVRKGILTTYLGGLRPVCWKLELATWGATADVPLLSVVNNLRATVTQIETQALQQSSHYAALRTISPESRKQLHKVDPNFLIATPVLELHRKPVLELHRKGEPTNELTKKIASQVPAFDRVSTISHFGVTSEPLEKELQGETSNRAINSVASQVPAFDRVSTTFNINNQLESPSINNQLEPPSKEKSQGETSNEPAKKIASQVPAFDRVSTISHFGVTSEPLPFVQGETSTSFINSVASQVPAFDRVSTDLNVNKPLDKELQGETSNRAINSVASQVPVFGRVSTTFNINNLLEPLSKENHQCSNTSVSTQPKPVLRHELGVQSSPNSIVGQVPFVLHVSRTRLFVSRNFLCFGATQNSISRTLGISVKTTQRHQKIIGLSHLQLCQEKNEYKDIRQTLRMEFHSYDVYDQNNRTRVGFKDCGDSYRFEDGVVIGSKTSEPNTYSVKKDGFLNRFFKLGTQYFLAKCNIYREELQLTTMRFAKKLFKQESRKRLQKVSL